MDAFARGAAVRDPRVTAPAAGVATQPTATVAALQDGRAGAAGATDRARRRPDADSHDGAGDPHWGAPRIHGELLKLGVDVSQPTVAKYMVRRGKPPSQTWRAFLANHLPQIAAADFFVVPTATCRMLFVLVILAHERRRIVHIAVTDHPSAAWTAQQLREAVVFHFSADAFQPGT